MSYLWIFQYICDYSNPVIFLGVGAFDYLKWTYDGAFELLFGLGSGGFEQKKKIQKFKCPGGGTLKLLFDWYTSQKANKSDESWYANQDLMMKNGGHWTFSKLRVD